MTVLIAWENLADDATVTTDSEITTLPASNVQQEHVAQKWKTTSGDKDAYLIFDMGSSVTIDILAVLGSNITASGTVQVRASDADPTVVASLLLDTGALASGAFDDYGAIYKQFASTVARYWRVDLADATVADNLEVGRVFLGPSWEPTYNMMLGVAYMARDNSLITKSRAGQRYAEEMGQQRVISFELDFLDEDEMFTNAFALAHRNGVVRDVLVVPSIDGSYLAQKSVFGTCEASTPIVNERLSLYRQKFTIEERL